jgi:hypothetical protein
MILTVFALLFLVYCVNGNDGEFFVYKGVLFFLL